VPGSVGDHVGKIQQALIELDGASIAADELADKSYGPSTADAVLAYKKKRNIINRSYQTQSDNIVGIMTMVVLDKEMLAEEGGGDGVPLVARGMFGECHAAVQKASGSAHFVPDPDIVTGVTHLIPQVRIAIAAAEFRLLTAAPHVTNRKQTLPSGPFNEPAKESLRLLDKVFGFFKFNNPRPAFDNLRRVFRNMTVALNRSFRNRPAHRSHALCAQHEREYGEGSVSLYSSWRSLPWGKSETDLGVPANRIYLCSNLARPLYVSGS
jgi:hypothetical protein